MAGISMSRLILRYSQAQQAEDETHWKFITVHYQASKRPVRIELNVNDQLLQQEIEETIEVIRKSGQLNQQQNLIEKLAASKQVIAIEIDYSGLTDTAWEMIDCLEAYLAKKLSGIVYAPDDGFYDEELQPIYKLETPIGIG
jgi:hypothetical protein